MTDNEYIVKLIETVKMMMTVNKKQQQFTITLIYTAVLQKSLPAWPGPSQECNVLTCLARELIMTCSGRAALDRNQLISQVIESINKMKNSFIVSKMIAAKQLFNENILIITNMIMIKKKLECDLI